MNKFKLLAAIALTLISAVSFGQKKQEPVDWTSVNFEKAYKLDVKVPGGVAKSLKSVPTFIADYKVNQRIEQHAVNQKGGGPSVFSGASFQGVEQAVYQKMIDDLHSQLTSELEKAGITIADGNAVVNGEYATGLNDGKNDFAGIHDGSIIEEKVDMTKDRQAIFRPTEPLVYTNRKIAGNFAFKLAKNQNINVITITYWITFAGFDADRGYKSKSLSTFPLLSITPIATILTPKGTYGTVTMGAMYGNEGWSTGVEEVKSRDGSFWGLSSSADYVVRAKQDEFVKEVTAMVGSAQKAMVDLIKAELK